MLFIKNLTIYGQNQILSNFWYKIFKSNLHKINGSGNSISGISKKGNEKKNQK